MIYVIETVELFTEEKSGLDDSNFPEKPEVVVFATYWSPSKYPVKVSVMGEMVYVFAFVVD